MLSKAPLLPSFSLSPLRCGVPPRPQPPPPPAPPPPIEERPALSRHRSLFLFLPPILGHRSGRAPRRRSAAADAAAAAAKRIAAAAERGKREREFLFPSLSSAAFAADLRSPKDGEERKSFAAISPPPFPPPTEKNFECKCDASAGERRKGGQ